MDPIIADTDFLLDFLVGTTSARLTLTNLLKDSFYIITTVITVSELYYGKYRRKWQEKRTKVLKKLVSSITVLTFHEVHAKEYGKIRASLVNNGLDIGFADVAIASIAIIEDIPLLTANTRYFQRIEGLNIREYKKNTN